MKKIEQIEMYGPGYSTIYSIEDVLRVVQTMDIPVEPSYDETDQITRCWNYRNIELFKCVFTLKTNDRMAYEGSNEQKFVYFYEHPKDKYRHHVTFFKGHEVINMCTTAVAQLIIMDKLRTLDELKDFIISKEPGMSQYFKERQEYIKKRPNVTDIEKMDKETPILLFGWRFNRGAFRNFYSLDYEYITTEKPKLWIGNGYIIVDKNLNQLWPNATGQRPVELLNVLKKTKDIERL